MKEVICGDALEWLKAFGKKEGHSFVTSMPDISEFNGMSLADWKKWFMSTAGLVLSCTHEDSVAIFYQSDIKVDGTWVDKSFLCQKVAEEMGVELLWHKIVARAPAGTITMGRPAYSHIVCFSKNVRAKMDKSTADIMPEMGEKFWERGMGSKPAQMIAKFIREQTSSTTLVNPFCGQGIMLAAAEDAGLHAIGIERSPKRAETARTAKIIS